MRINREKIQRMIDAQGGSSGGGGMSSAALESMLAMYATRQWVGENFLNVKEGGTVEAPVTFQEAVTLEKTLAVTGAVTMASTLAVTGNITMGSKLVATQEWTNLNYVSIAFFSRLFQAYNGNTAVNPNDTTSTIDNIKAMFGFWTNFYISALGTGGASTLGLRLSQLDDVNVAGVTNGQVLTWNTSTGKWIASTPSSGVDMATVWAAMAAVDATKKIDNSHLNLSTFFTDLSNTNDNKISVIIGGVTKTLTVGYATNAGDAATLGGTAKSGLFTDLSNTNDNKISVTIGGVTKTLTVGYATNAGDAATLGGTAKSGLFTALSSDWTTNLSATIGGTTKSISSLCADYANRLRYSRTLWGQSFDGSANVSGDMTSVGDITMQTGDHSILTTNGNLVLGYSNNEWVKVMDLCSYNGSSYWNIHQNGNSTFANVLSNGYVTALSDIRYKEVVNRFQLDVETIAKASLIQYRWKDKHDDVLHVGGIAQEWQKILPEAVVEGTDGRLSMDYGVIGMVSAVSLARKIQDQDNEICDLREKNAQLERRLQRLESMFAVDVD